MQRSPDQWFRRIPRFVWINAYLVLVTSGLSILFAGWAYDDPFITYRYATNLSSGFGLVYNPGETLLSTTTPLFALLLAMLHPLYSNLPNLAVCIGAFSMTVGGLCLWDLLDHPGLNFSRWIGLLFYPLFPLVNSTLGSETPLYLALCLGAFASYRHGRYRLAALCASLAALARPDAILVAVVLGLHYLWTHPRKQLSWRIWLTGLPWQAILIYLSIGLAWLIYAWTTYDSPIPLTLFAKQQQAVVAGGQAFMPGSLTIISWYSSWSYLLQAVLALLGLLHGLLHTPVLRWLAAWTVLYFIAYSLLGVTRYFWYYAPLVPMFLVSVGCGLDGLRLLLQKMRDKVKGTKIISKTTHKAVSLLPGLLMLCLLLVQAGKLWNQHLKPDVRYPIYRAAGEWLRENTPSNASVGTLEVGIIGYYARRPMVDFSGLIQPDIAVNIGQTGSYSTTAFWAVTQYNPKYLVLHQGLFPEIESTILPNCQLEVTFPGSVYDYAYDIGIYACLSAAG